MTRPATVLSPPAPIVQGTEPSPSHQTGPAPGRGVPPVLSPGKPITGDPLPGPSTPDIQSPGTGSTQLLATPPGRPGELRPEGVVGTPPEDRPSQPAVPIDGRYSTNPNEASIPSDSRTRHDDAGVTAAVTEPSRSMARNGVGESRGSDWAQLLLSVSSAQQGGDRVEADGTSAPPAQTGESRPTTELKDVSPPGLMPLSLGPPAMDPAGDGNGAPADVNGRVRPTAPGGGITATPGARRNRSSPGRRPGSGC